MRRISLAFALLLPACVGPADPSDGAEVGSLTAEVRVCADAETVEGIDVSKWQGHIDWDPVADAGIRFAFIRVNHGLADVDERFTENWSEARRVGILRGAYQYFQPNEDATEQAQLMLSLMGTLEPDDLPPVLDVEEADGETAASITQKIHEWSDVVEAAIGRKPIIYTAKYFWQDSVGAPADFLDHPLWVANYGADCPLMADPWPRWSFWQYTSTGALPGISTNIDRDHWNGTYAELVDFATGVDPTDPTDPTDPGPTDPGPTDPGPTDPGPTDPGPGNPGDAIGGCAAGGGGSGAVAPLILGLGLFVRRRRRSAGATPGRDRAAGGR